MNGKVTGEVTLESINADLINIKKSLYIMTRLMLLAGSEQIKSQDKIMVFYNETKESADEKFGKD